MYMPTFQINVDIGLAYISVYMHMQAIVAYRLIKLF